MLAVRERRGLADTFDEIAPVALRVRVAEWVIQSARIFLRAIELHTPQSEPFAVCYNPYKHSFTRRGIR